MRTAGRQHELGLDRFPLAAVYTSGEPYPTRHADLDLTQPRGVVEGLGVRS